MLSIFVSNMLQTVSKQTVGGIQSQVEVFITSKALSISRNVLQNNDSSLARMRTMCCPTSRFPQLLLRNTGALQLRHQIFATIVTTIVFHKVNHRHLEALCHMVGGVYEKDS